MKLLFAAMLLAVGLGVAPASSDELWSACIDRSPGTNTQWAQCGGEWIEREDDRLNATWQRVYGATTGQTHTDLLAEQRAWIGYREAACRFYSNGDWGREGQVLDAPACIAGVIAARTAELEAYGEFLGAR
jgi:uncharacterized protein YecT (DUF1311 family)